MNTFYKIKIALITVIIIVSAAIQNYAQLSLDLAGTGDYVSTTYQINNTAFTVEYDMFVHTYTSFTGGVTFVCSSPGNTPGPVDFYLLGSGIGSLNVGNCSGFSGINTSSPISLGAWHNIAYRYTGGSAGIQLYVDGIFIGTAGGFGVAGPGPFSATGFRIGDRVDGATNADAKFDNVRIWSIARTPAQIAADITTCFTGSEPGLDILYTMEEGSGTTIFDAALGNGAQDGTITGSVSWTSGNGAPTTSNPIEYQTSCQDFLWSVNSVNYTNSGIFNHNTTNGLGCTVINTLDLVITPTAPDQPLSASDDTICSGNSVDITLVTSKPGFNYTLVDYNLNAVAGPYYGNEDPIVFNTGPIFANDSYSIFTESNSNSSLSFDGLNDQVLTNTGSGSLSGTFTIEMWIKPNSNAMGSTLAIAGSRGPVEFGCDFKLQDGNLIHGDIGNGSGWITTVADAAFAYNAGQWYHIAYVVTNTGFTIYADGNIIGSGSFGGAPLLFNPTHNLVIGNGGTNITGENFDGNIDEVRVWNVARTQTQIQNHRFFELSGTESGLILYYKLNEGLELVGLDQTSNNYDGSLLNMDTAICWQSDVPFANEPCGFYLNDYHDVYVNPVHMVTQTIETCDSYTWNSNLYTQTGVYSDTTSSVTTGCDSVNVLNLIINKVVTNATISDDSLCIGDNTTLNVTPIVTAPSYLGDPSSTDENDEEGYPCVYGNYYEGAKHQILILASELTASGMAAGDINGMQFFVSNLNELTDSLLGFNIKLAHTNVPDLSSGDFETPIFTNCYSSTYFKVDTGTTTHIFSTPFTWDGTSNILIETCYNNDVLDYQENPNMPYTTTPFTSVIYYEDDGNPSVCSETSGTTSEDRPNFRLLGNTINYTIAWSNPTGGIADPSLATTLATPTASGQYMVMVTNPETGCTNGDTLDVWYGNPNVNLGADIVQLNPPATLDAGSGFSSYNWSNSANTQTTSVNTNGTYHVTVVDALGCSDSDTIQVNFTVGISNADGSEANATFFPNPTTGILNMHLQGFEETKLQVEFIDINGKSIRTMLLENITTDYTTTFDLTELAEGSYFIKIFSPTSGISKQIMIIK